MRKMGAVWVMTHLTMDTILWGEISANVVGQSGIAMESHTGDR
jgi:hypothetical protein